MKITRIVKIITFINVIAFLLAYNMDYSFYDEFALWDGEGIGAELYQPHQWITHMFLHGGIAHIIINMLVFLSFGPLVENFFGEKKFILFYMLSGLGAAFLQVILTDIEGPMVGASGAIFGVVAAAAIIKPNLTVYLFFLIPVKAKWIVPLILIFEIYSGIASPGDHVAHYAHVGGALAGGMFFIGDKLINNKS